MEGEGCDGDGEFGDEVAIKGVKVIHELECNQTDRGVADENAGQVGV